MLTKCLVLDYFRTPDLYFRYDETDGALNIFKKFAWSQFCDIDNFNYLYLIIFVCRKIKQIINYDIYIIFIEVSSIYSVCNLFMPKIDDW